MKSTKAEVQEAEFIDIDDETRAAIELGLAAVARGETVTLEQAQVNLKRRYQAWLRIQEEIPA